MHFSRPRASHAGALVCLIAATLFSFSLFAQSNAAAAPQSSAQVEPSTQAGAAPRLFIGPGDEGDFSVYGVTELAQHFRVGSEGEIYLPLIGKVIVAGMTAEEAQAAIEKKLVDGGFLKNPHVTIYIKEYTTQGITVTGEVNKPGVYPAQNARRLYDLFLAAGGLTQRAGRKVSIAHAGSDEKPVDLTLSDDPAEAAMSNITLKPGDTVVVARAGIVYVVGEVNRAGGYIFENAKPLTVSQAIALAFGPTHIASLNKTHLIRRSGESLSNTEVDVKKILEAKAPDMALQPDDILMIPSSRMKAAFQPGNVVGTLTNLAIYRF